MLESFTISTFSNHRGETFYINSDSGNSMEAQLSEVSSKGKADPGMNRREPFSLVFTCAGDTVLPQRIYTLTHERIGTFDLFLVPVNKNEQGVHYEAVFT